MNKTKEKIIDEQNQEQNQPAYVAELLLNGTAILTAKTRDELAEMVNDIPANVHYGAGAVGFNSETGVFTLRVDVIN